MRKKALLVGARASFEGPWVNLEEGIWLVKPPSGVCIVTSGSAIVNNLLEHGLRIQGPCRVQAVVGNDYKGLEVCLSVQEVT